MKDLVRPLGRCLALAIVLLPNPSPPSRRDTAQLLARCVEVEDVDFAIVNGISNHRRGRLDLEISRKVLGYAPEDGTVFPRR